MTWGSRRRDREQGLRRGGGVRAGLAGDPRCSVWSCWSPWCDRSSGPRGRIERRRTAGGGGSASGQPLVQRARSQGSGAGPARRLRAAARRNPGPSGADFLGAYAPQPASTRGPDGAELPAAPYALRRDTQPASGDGRWAGAARSVVHLRRTLTVGRQAPSPTRRRGRPDPTRRPVPLSNPAPSGSRGRPPLAHPSDCWTVAGPPATDVGGSEVAGQGRAPGRAVRSSRREQEEHR